MSIARKYGFAWVTLGFLRKVDPKGAADILAKIDKRYTSK